MNVRAADLAASNRLGATSLAFIDSDTSMATMIVARSRGTFTDEAGRAHPMIIPMTAPRNSSAATCRRHPGCLGATCASRSRLVNRTVYVHRAVHQPGPAGAGRAQASGVAAARGRAAVPRRGHRDD